MPSLKPLMRMPGTPGLMRRISSKASGPFILGMMLLTATIGAFEALLFAMLGKVVDWLAAVEPARASAFEAALREAGVSATRIGEARVGETGFVEADGTPRHFAHGSFQHF